MLSSIAARFVFAYLILYCLPSNSRVNLLDALPIGGDWLQEFFSEPWQKVCPWFAVHIFHLSGPVTKYHPTGSGDTTLDYVQVFVIGALAAFIAFIWSVVDRNRHSERLFYPWVRLLVRFTLAFTLLSYGFSKIFPLQFPEPDFTRLTESYGESSPTGLLWTFMGASPAYEMFSGGMETIAGVLLLFRRTSTLGALVSATVMLNIVVLNFCFDVSVKLYSSHLFLMSLFLLIPDLRSLWHFLVLRRIAKLEGVWIPRFERQWFRITARILQVLVIASVLYGNISGGYEVYKSNRHWILLNASLYGMWDVESSASQISSNASLVPEREDWRQVMIDAKGRIGIRTSGGKLLRFGMDLNESKQTFKLKGWRNEHTAEFYYRQPDPQQLTLTGTLDAKPLRVQLHRYAPQPFLLQTRGFHWISEDPFNF